MRTDAIFIHSPQLLPGDILIAGGDEQASGWGDELIVHTDEYSCCYREFPFLVLDVINDCNEYKLSVLTSHGDICAIYSPDYFLYSIVRL
jgi:hypothetical protein